MFKLLLKLLSNEVNIFSVTVPEWFEYVIGSHSCLMVFLFPLVSCLRENQHLDIPISEGSRFFSSKAVKCYS